MSLLTFPWPQLLNANGDTYPGAKLYFYETGTNTLATTYTDAALSVPHANPVVADSQGVFAPIYLAAKSYKAILRTAADVTLFSADPVRGISGVSATAVANIAALIAIAVPTNGMSVEVTEAGRGGLFVFDTSLTAAANNGTTFKATDATAGSWVRRYSGALNVKWFGAIGNGVADDTDEIQAALTLGSTNKLSVFLPAGTYIISDTLQITSPTISYQPAHVFGEGRAHTGSTSQTTIDASAVLTKPALHISAGAGVVLEDFAVIGPNVEPGPFPVLPGDIGPGVHFYEMDWVTPGVRDSRYSPQCGICVDGNTGATPPDGGYPGFTYKANSNASVDLVFNRITLWRHVVGLMLCPGLSLNADQIAIRDCQFAINKVAIAAGHGQTKGTVVFGGNVLRARSAFDGIEYGQQQGRSPVFVGTQFIQVFELISWNAAFGPAMFNGIYAEQLNRIGYAGSSGVSSGIHFYGSEIAFYGDAGSTLSPICFEGLNTQFNWYGGRFNGAAYADGPLTNSAYNIIAQRTVFDGVDIGLYNRHRPFVQGPAGLAYPATLRNVRVTDGSGTSVVYGSEPRPGTSLAGRVSAHHSNDRLVVTPYNTASIAYDYVRESNAGEIVAPGTSSNFAFTNPSFSFDNTDAAGSFLVGDILYWRMKVQGASATQWIVPAFRVTAVAAPTITCDYLFRRTDYDETYAPTGSMYIAVHHWAPGQALTADTAGTTALTNVSPTTILQNGDWIMANTGIAPNTRVVSGGGTASITLSRAATDTQVGKALYFDRLHTAKTAAAFGGSVRTFQSGDATPYVGLGEIFRTAGTTAITDFDNGVVGQTIRILATDTITITNNAAIKLNGTANYVMTVTDTLTLTMFDDQVWQEVARSVN